MPLAGPVGGPATSIEALILHTHAVVVPVALLQLRVFVKAMIIKVLGSGEGVEIFLLVLVGAVHLPLSRLRMLPMIVVSLTRIRVITMRHLSGIVHMARRVLKGTIVSGSVMILDGRRGGRGHGEGVVELGVGLVGTHVVGGFKLRG